MSPRRPVPPTPQKQPPQQQPKTAAPRAGASSARATGVVVRPWGLRLLSAGSIVHASLILMAVVVLGVMALGGDARVGLAMKALRQSTVVWCWTLFFVATSFVLGFVLLYNAIGTLSLTPWSQRTAKLWAIVWMALASVGLLVNLAWAYPMLKEASPGHFSFGRLLIVTWLHIAGGIIWPAFVLFYMNSRTVKQAYARLAGGAAAI